MNDSQWKHFVGLCDKNFEECEFASELIAVCFGKEDIAKVVYFHNKGASLKWLRSKIPAMGNLIPYKEIEKGNVDAVRNVLLSFPC
ncbi:hypothetical protein [Pseudoalteromonas sp. SR45-5]|uniref:hypothetical protein n=1 Tax=Pseudoalteromonas sp. SR45-5 TaxID=2760928 RepID=UPI0015FC1709|nr:hypothetical protein [Pseudoalteromonas sp. SR45-5]MBB1355792.1 hypothetical protein [Pseudoalteromonas sp. SR45-5]